MIGAPDPRACRDNAAHGVRVRVAEAIAITARDEHVAGADCGKEGRPRAPARAMVPGDQRLGTALSIDG
jgi:hypothetical protein